MLGCRTEYPRPRVSSSRQLVLGLFLLGLDQFILLVFWTRGSSVNFESQGNFLGDKFQILLLLLLEVGPEQCAYISDKCLGNVLMVTAAVWATVALPA